MGLIPLLDRDGSAVSTSHHRSLFLPDISQLQFPSFSYLHSPILLAPTHWKRERPMLDLIMMALGLGFFVLSIGYAVACDRL
jgi:hypothetical protein